MKRSFILYFYVHGSVRRESMSIIVQQDATIYSLLYFRKLIYMFWVVNSPIIRSTYNCNYSYLVLVKLRKMQCVKSAKDERYVPISATFRDRTIEGR